MATRRRSKQLQDRHLEEMRGAYLANEGEKAAWDEEEELLLEDERATTAAPKSWFGRNAGNLLNNVAGSQTLTKEEIEPVMADLRKTLLEKNVAVEVADAVTKVSPIHSSVRKSSASGEPRR